MQEGHSTAQPLLASTFSSKTAYTPLQNPPRDADYAPSAATYGEVDSRLNDRGYRPSSSPPLPPLPLPPIPRTARERKLLEARTQDGALAGSSRVPIASGSGAHPSSHSVPTALVDTSLNPDIQPDIIIQHRDGGAGIVHELPPPYADRTLLAPTSPTSPSDPTPSTSSRLHHNELS